VASVSERPLNHRHAALSRTIGRLLLALVCVAAVAGVVWMLRLHHNDSPGPVSREPETQASREPEPQVSHEPEPQASHEPQAQKSLPPPNGDKPPPEKEVADKEAAVRAEIDSLEKESIKIAQTLIDDFPDTSDPLGLMGMVYNRHDQTTKALECWERALKCNPNRPDLYDAMAMVALRKGEYERAEELCRKGLERSTQLAQLHYHLAQALNGLNRADESVSELQIAIKLSPDDGDSHCLLGATYSLLDEYEKARSSYEAAVRLQPGSLAAQYGVAVTYTKLGMADQSKRAMEQYQKLQAENTQVQRSRRDVVFDAVKYRRVLAMTCSNAGTVYIKSGRPEKAEPLLRRGADIDPKDVDCRIQLVQLLCLANRLREAAPVIRELIEIEPNNPIFYLRLAEVYSRIELLDEARKAAKKATELAPESDECRRFLAELESKK